MKKLVILLLTITTVFTIKAIVESNLPKIKTEDELTAFLKEHPKTVIEFYNPDCPVCQIFARSQTFPTLAEENPTIGFALINIENGQLLYKKFGVTQTPTFIFFNKSHEVPDTRFAAAIGKAEFTRRISAAFSR